MRLRPDRRHRVDDLFFKDLDRAAMFVSRPFLVSTWFGTGEFANDRVTDEVGVTFHDSAQNPRISVILSTAFRVNGLEVERYRGARGGPRVVRQNVDPVAGGFP